LNCAEELRFVHLNTRVWREPGSRQQLQTVGQTIWVGLLRHGRAAIGWDWVLMSRGSIALADPMSIVSNLRFIGEQGETVTTPRSMLLLNVLVHDLPWQDEVWRYLTERNDEVCGIGKPVSASQLARYSELPRGDDSPKNEG